MALTRVYVYFMGVSYGQKNFFLHTRYGYTRVSPVPTNLISPILSHPGPDKNHVYLMHRLCRKSRICVVK